MRINSPEELKSMQEFYSQALNAQKKRILVCAGTGCVAGGSLQIYARLKELMKERGIPTALATSTGRPRTQRRLEMTGLAPYFSAAITGDQVVHSKPDPEIYLLACEALHTDPAHTLAIEDSRNGILSASRAGMPVIMVPDMIPPTPDLEALLLRRCSSLLEVRDLLPQFF